MSCPAKNCSLLGEPIERGVDLGCRKDGAVLFELALFLRVEDALPLRVAPTARSQQDLRDSKRLPRKYLPPCYVKSTSPARIRHLT